MDPIQGRFISRDTIGLWGDANNLGNPYSYAGNNPWTNLDPYGEESLAVQNLRLIEANDTPEGRRRFQEEDEHRRRYREQLESGNGTPYMEFADSILNSATNVISVGFVGESSLDQAAEYDNRGYLYEATVAAEVTGVVGGVATLGSKVVRWGKKGISYLLRKNADELPKGAPEYLPAPKSPETIGSGNGGPENGTKFVDPKGNAIPTPPSGRITGSPDGRFIQARDAHGNPTGVRIDGGHSPKTHTDPRALGPHGHVPGDTNADGTP